MDVGSSPLRVGAKRPPSPLLPLSPISNPSSPPRKRPRTSNWDPPEHIPDFLPPFPTISDDTPVEPVDVAPTPHMPQPSMSGPSTLTETQPEKTPATLAQSLTTAAASDFLVQVPYSQSALSSVPEWHLPSAPSSSSTQPRQPHRLPIPIPEQSLLKAFHYILTNPPPKELPPLNPSRHKVALALIQQTQSNPRFSPADSLFGTVAPCPPRVATMGPSHPVAIGDRKGEGHDKDTKLPVAASRPVAAIERTAPFISQQTSRIPELAHLVLPVRLFFPSVFSATYILRFFSLQFLLVLAASHTLQSSIEERNRLFMAEASQRLGMPILSHLYSMLSHQHRSHQSPKTSRPPTAEKAPPNPSFQTPVCMLHGTMRPKTLRCR
jgi:hypothetical protein